jgi:hypothetical protein
VTASIPRVRFFCRVCGLLTLLTSPCELCWMEVLWACSPRPSLPQWAARVVRLGDVARHQPDSFAGRLPVCCLISGRLLHGEPGRLLHGELGRRVCLQAFVRVGAPLRIERS